MDLTDNEITNIIRLKNEICSDNDDIITELRRLRNMSTDDGEIGEINKTISELNNNDDELTRFVRNLLNNNR
ncbi:MAG: hypothetical protein SPL99_07675 [Catonella sp.]|nr:hypothetical protein [Catonella sp.]